MVDGSQTVKCPLPFVPHSNRSPGLPCVLCENSCSTKQNGQLSSRQTFIHLCQNRQEVQDNTMPQTPERWGRSPGKSSLTGEQCFPAALLCSGDDRDVDWVTRWSSGGVPLYPASLLSPLCQCSPRLFSERLETGSIITHLWHFLEFQLTDKVLLCY